MSYKAFKENINSALGKTKGDLLLKNANIINFFTNSIENNDILIKNGIIVGIGEYNKAKNIIDLDGKYVTAGFIDSHIHLESNIVSPKNFSKIALSCGTTAILTDPHEIANVRGKEGIEYMLESTEGLDMDVFFMLPSCVPATKIEDNYGNLDAKDLRAFLKHPRVLGLAEMMNFPGVLNADKGIYEKIAMSKIVDGHAPLLSGKELNAYLSAGIKTDHECTNLEEALEKISKGMYVNIREGSGAHNLKALSSLIKYPYASRIMLATDDKHPDELLEEGHINYIIRKAIEYGADPYAAYMCASYIPAQYMGLTDRGYIGVGKRADIAVLDDINNVNVQMTIKDGRVVYDGNLRLSNDRDVKMISAMDVDLKTNTDFILTNKKIGIEMVSYELITKKYIVKESDDLCYLAVFERYHNTNNHAMCMIKGYGLKLGAIATSIAHDSHNIIVVGKDIDSMCAAVNAIIKAGGGMAVARDGKLLDLLELDIAGLMTSLPVNETIEKINSLKKYAKALGVADNINPFMNLSFLSLPVIPEVKLTSRGLVDVATQEIIND